MQIKLSKLGKHYQSQWVFKDLDFTFEAGEKYAIVGSNGSGKSTLLKLIAGQESEDKGEIAYENLKEGITNSQFSFCAPYTQAIMEYTTLENLKFAQEFKTFKQGLSPEEVFELLPEAKRSKSKSLRQLSSGMVQRVKLVLALMAETPIHLLDEPLNNLDTEGCNWYHKIVNSYCKENTLIVASNNAEEYSFCTQFIEMGNLPLRHGKIKDLS